MIESRTHHLRRSATRRLVVLAGALSIMWSVPGATAQGFYVGGFYDFGPPAPISPRSVAYRLQDRGFTEISRPRFDGEAYVVEATNPVGARVRLFVDARDGLVIGRQRLDTPFYPSARPARPGYGWTEEDLQPRRTARAGEAPIPPGTIPDGARMARPPVGPPADAGREPAARAVTTDANPLGVNPDAGTVSGDRTRLAAPPRKTARLSEPRKPVAPRAAPMAPRLDPVDTAAAKAEPRPKPALAEPPAASPDAPAPERAASETPVTEEPKAVETPKLAEAPKKGETWHDPPPGERKVRVIDGATVVPGGGDTPPPSAN